MPLRQVWWASRGSGPVWYVLKWRRTGDVPEKNNVPAGEMSGFHDGEYESDCLLGFCSLWSCRSLPTVQMCSMPPVTIAYTVSSGCHKNAVGDSICKAVARVISYRRQDWLSWQRGLAYFSTFTRANIMVLPPNRLQSHCSISFPVIYSVGITIPRCITRPVGKASLNNYKNGTCAFIRMFLSFPPPPLPCIPKGLAKA